MKELLLRSIMALTLIAVLSCVSTRSRSDKAPEGQKVSEEHVQMLAERTVAFGPAQDFEGSPYEEIGNSGLFNTHPARPCRIAVLPNGNDSFDARIQTLKNADTSVGILCRSSSRRLQNPPAGDRVEDPTH